MNEAEAQKTTPKRRTGRSPAYPVFSVEKAINQTNAFFTQEGEYAAPLVSAFKSWGYSIKSSGGRQTLSTLKYYGLIDVTGEGDSRKIKISEIARRILLDQREDQTEKKQLIRKVALNPSAHKTLYDEYPNGLASDDSVRHFLVFSEKFKQDAANELIAEFKETSEFAGLYKQDQSPITYEDDNTDTSDNSKIISFEIGEFVNWESNHQVQWPTPRKIIAVDADENGNKYLQVIDKEGGNGWIPATQAIKDEESEIHDTKTFLPPPPFEPSTKHPAHKDAVLEGWHEERLIDDGGDEILIRYNGDPTLERYKFIRDYLEFKISRLQTKME